MAPCSALLARADVQSKAVPSKIVSEVKLVPNSLEFFEIWNERLQSFSRARVWNLPPSFGSSKMSYGLRRQEQVSKYAFRCFFLPFPPLKIRDFSNCRCPF